MPLAARCREELLACTQRVLLESAKEISDSQSASDLLQSVIAVVSEAYNNFAQAWNSKQGSAITRRLPLEVLGQCLHTLDFRSLVALSHVSRQWRAIAIAERRLWTSYSHNRNIFSRRSLAQLAAMLERSRPLPFRLCLWYDRTEFKEQLLFDTLRPDMGRLEEYTGLRRVLLSANTTNTPMPLLVVLDCCDKYIPEELFNIPEFLTGNGAPKLLEVVMPRLSFEGSFGVFQSLQHLSYYAVNSGSPIRHLFRHCPNLVRLTIGGFIHSSALPAGPLPLSLRDVAINCDDSRAEGIARVRVDYSSALQPWYGQQLAVLRLGRASSFLGPLRMFIAAHEDSVSVTLQRSWCMLKCSERPDYWYDVSMSCSAVQLFVGLQVDDACAGRINTLSLSSDLLFPFFSAKLLLPVLTTFELCLNQPLYWQFRDDTDDDRSGRYVLRAPLLHHLRVNVPFVLYSDIENVVSAVSEHVLAHVRSWIIYDAAELESLTVRAPQEYVDKHIAALDLARLARNYVVDMDLP